MFKPTRGIILYSIYVLSINIRAEAFPTCVWTLQVLQLWKGSAHFQLRPGCGQLSGPGGQIKVVPERSVCFFCSIFWYIHVEKCGYSSFPLTAGKYFTVWIYHSSPISREESEQMVRPGSAQGNDSLLKIWIKDQLVKPESLIEEYCHRGEERNKGSAQ